MTKNKLIDLKIIYCLFFFNTGGIIYVNNVSVWFVHTSLLIISLFLGSYVVFVLFAEYRTKDLGSPTAITFGLFLFHFVLPGIMLSAGSLGFVYKANFNYIIEAQVLVCASLIAFRIGAIIASKNIQTKTIFQKSYGWKKKNIFIIIVLLVLAGWCVRLFFVAKGMYFQETRTSDGGLGGIYSSLRQIERFPMLALYLVAVFYYAKIYNVSGDRSNKRIEYWYYILLVIIGSEVVYWLPSGRKTDLLFVILIPYIIRYINTQKLPSKKTALIILLLISMYFPASYMYRISMDIGGHANESAVDGILATIDDIQKGRNSKIVSQKDNNYLFGRLSLLEPVSAAIRLVESGIWPISYGDNYLGLFVNLVPRVLWEEKPNFHYGTEFGYKAGYLKSRRTATSISVTFIGEAYFNFRWFAPIVMFCFGYFFSYVYYKGKRTHSLNWKILYVLTFPILLYPGGTFVLYFGGLIKSWIVVGMLILLMKTPHTLPRRVT